MDEHQCTNCGAALPRTGTYCLACDTPVPDAVRGLSVGDTQVVQNGRPVIGVAIAAAVIVVVAGIAFLAHSMSSGHADRSATQAAEKGVEVVVRAESGHSGACPYITPAVVGTPSTEKAACLALVDDDPGAHIKNLHGTPHRTGSKATVKLSGTLVDKTGRRPWARTFSVDKTGTGWALVWNGSAIAKAS